MTSLFQSQHLSSDFPFALEHLKNILHDNKYRFFLYVFSHNSTMKQFYYSHARMAREMNCSVSTIKRWVQDLKSLGLISIRSSAHLRTNIYIVNQCYLRNKHLFYSKYNNFLSVSLLTVSRLAIRANELLLRFKDIINPAKGENDTKKGSAMLQLNREQCEERSSHPKWVQDRALAIYNRKVASGVKIINHANFFMGILRSEAAAKQRPAGKQPQEKKDIEKKPFVRPAEGAYAIYKSAPAQSIAEKREKLIREIESTKKNLLKVNAYAPEDSVRFFMNRIQSCEEELKELDLKYDNAKETASGSNMGMD